MSITLRRKDGTPVITYRVNTVGEAVERAIEDGVSLRGVKLQGPNKRRAQENIMQMNLQTYADAFEWAERPTSGERYCKLKDGAPDWVDVQAIHAALNAILPDDWIYQHAELVADTLTRYNWQDGTDESDRVHEVAAGLVDLFTADLLEWLKASWAREYYEHARAEFVSAKDLDDGVRRAQYLALEDIAYEILRQCREQAS